MRFQVFCRECNEVLLDAARLRNPRWAVDWYTDLYEKLKGKCPGCGRSLPLPFEYALKMKIEVSVGT